MNSFELCNQLAEKFPIYVSNLQTPVDCIRLQIIINQYVNVRSNLVYVSGPNMPQPSSVKEDCLYILYAPQTKMNMSSINTVYYNNPDLFLPICEAIHIALIDDDVYKIKENELHQIFRMTTDLTTILKRCYDLVQNPLLINDASFKCLSAWPDYPIGLRKFDQMLEYGYAQRDYLESAEEIIRISEKYKLQGTKAIHFEYSKTLMTIAVTPIYYNGNVIGGLEIIEHNKPIDETDIQLVNLISILLPLEMLSYIHREVEYGQNFNQLFYELISLQPCNYEKMEMRLKEIPSLNYTYRIIHVEMPFEMNHMPLLFINDLKNIFPTCHTVLNEYSIILFINTEELTGDANTKLRSFSSEHNTLICLSENFINLLDTPILVNQIKVMSRFLSMQGVNEGVYNYKEYRFSTMLTMMQQSELLKQFIHPGVMELAKYDKKHHANFLETVENYLLYQSNAAKCSQQMMLHRNSLIYRVEKASSIMGVSLDDPYDCFNILVSIKIYRTLYD